MSPRVTLVHEEFGKRPGTITPKAHAGRVQSEISLRGTLYLALRFFTRRSCSASS